MTPAEKVAATKRHKSQRPIVARFGLARKYPWKCRIRDARLALRLSLRDVATGAKLSIAGLSEIERGTDPRLTTARRLAVFFGSTVEQLWPELR